MQRAKALDFDLKVEVAQQTGQQTYQAKKCLQIWLHEEFVPIVDDIVACKNPASIPLCAAAIVDFLDTKQWFVWPTRARKMKGKKVSQ